MLRILVLLVLASTCQAEGYANIRTGQVVPSGNPAAFETPARIALGWVPFDPKLAPVESLHPRAGARFIDPRIWEINQAGQVSVKDQVRLDALRSAREQARLNVLQKRSWDAQRQLLEIEDMAALGEERPVYLTEERVQAARSYLEERIETAETEIVTRGGTVEPLPEEERER